MTMFQVVLKDHGSYIRPYPMTPVEQEVMSDMRRAINDFPGSEPVAIYGEGVDQVEQAYMLLKRGYPVHVIALNEEGWRQALEFAPLRDEYPVGTCRLITEVGLSRQQIRSLIMLMGRVQLWNELGGEHDGEECCGDQTGRAGATADAGVAGGSGGDDQEGPEGVGLPHHEG